jgi:hypothetical protein
MKYEKTPSNHRTSLVLLAAIVTASACGAAFGAFLMWSLDTTSCSTQPPEERVVIVHEATPDSEAVDCDERARQRDAAAAAALPDGFVASQVEAHRDELQACLEPVEKLEGVHLSFSIEPTGHVLGMEAVTPRGPSPLDGLDDHEAIAVRRCLNLRSLEMKFPATGAGRPVPVSAPITADARAR